MILWGIQGYLSLKTNIFELFVKTCPNIKCFATVMGKVEDEPQRPMTNDFM